MEIDWQWHYYKANQYWVSVNPTCIIPFIIACICRFRDISVKKYLWTDHLARSYLGMTCFFYVYDSIVKYMFDGADTVCEKSLYIHHISSLFIIVPIVINSYIPWWANPIGFLHGFLVYFPDFEMLNYVYAVAILFFQYMLYQ